MDKKTLKFWIGIVLLTTNQVFGWGGMAICAALALKTGEKKFWITAGMVIYAISWAMAGLGVVLAGPEGVKLIKDFIAKIKNAWLRRGSGK